jgi:hypothetical protein
VRRASGVGLALALVYVLVAAGHARLGPVPPGRARPLFDGFAPPPPYNWVKPPKEFASGNQVPTPSSFDVALGPAGSVVSGGSSQDGQVIFSMPAGSIAAHPPDTKVKVDITPLDPATLPPPPPGVAADGNAYRVAFSYQPSGTAVNALASPSDVFFVVPQPASALLFSGDGTAWEPLPARPAADPTQVGGAASRPGFYLAVAPPVAPATGVTGSVQSNRGLLGVAAVTVALAVVLGLAPVGWRRLRGRRAG